MAAGADLVTMGDVAHQRLPQQAPEPCPACDRVPTVLVAIRHTVMRRWTGELLAAEHGCWAVVQPRTGEMLVDAINRSHPDLVIVDSVDFPACCQAALRALPSERVIVIGPEPDRAYRSRALALGAGGWVCRDHVGEELSGAMHAALACDDHPCAQGVPPMRSLSEECVASGGPS